MYWPIRCTLYKNPSEFITLFEEATNEVADEVTSLHPDAERDIPWDIQVRFTFVNIHITNSRNFSIFCLVCDRYGQLWVNYSWLIIWVLFRSPKGNPTAAPFVSWIPRAFPNWWRSRASSSRCPFFQHQSQAARILYSSTSWPKAARALTTS